MALPSPEELRNRTIEHRANWLERHFIREGEDFDLDGCRTMKEYLAKKVAEGESNDKHREHPLP